MFFAEKKNISNGEFIIFSENSLVSNLFFLYNIPQLSTYMVMLDCSCIVKDFLLASFPRVRNEVRRDK